MLSKNNINNRKIFKQTLFIALTVCISLLNKISDKKPAPIPNGVKLINAKSLPIKSPKI